jgi:DNA mismatch repair protein MutS
VTRRDRYRSSSVSAAASSRQEAGAEPTETSATGEAASDGGELDPDIEDVLDELRGTDVNNTSPLELMGRVQEWQRRLTDE